MIIPFNCNKVKVTSPYAVRTLDGVTALHTGYDLVGVGSWDVTAAVGGTVVQSRIILDKSNPTWQWGNYVCIKTVDGQYHYYCHMSSRAVEKGQIVMAGDKIGVMGNTGYSFGAHLHFEVRQPDGRTTICPEKILGIPNKVGTYEITQYEADLNTLVANGVINTPEYWINHKNDIQYLPNLIHNMAEVLNK